MAHLEKSQTPRVSHAASLQRMLELERKHKMERLQQPHTPENARGSGRAPEVPPYARSRTPLQARRPDSTIQQQLPVTLTSADRNNTLPPSLSLNIPQHQPPNGASKGKAVMKEREVQTPPLREDRREVGSLSMKTVTFSTQDDGEISDHSSICQSPTWDGYGQKKKKKKEEAELKKREKERIAREAKETKAAKKKMSSRLTKGPPPAIHPIYKSHVRAASAPLADAQHSPLDAEGQHQSGRSSRDVQGTDSEKSSMSSRAGSEQSVPNALRSPGFIGGVRLEREREIAMKRMMDARNGTRGPALDPSQQHQKSLSATPDSSPSMAPMPLKKRDADAPPVSYPPTASKTHSLPPNVHKRSRSGSLLAGAARLFNPRGHDYKNLKGSRFSSRNSSQDSVQTVQTVQSSTQSSHDRGRPANGSVGTQSRAQSIESHARSVSESIDERRGGPRLPSLTKTWSDTFNKGRTTSMIVSPPDSADGSFASLDKKAVKDFQLQNDFGFLSQPFSPLADGPPSPPGSLSASIKDKAKMSPKLEAVLAIMGPPVQPPPKKGLRESIKSGLKSSTAVNPVPPFLRRSQTDPVLPMDLPIPSDPHLLSSNPVSAFSSPKLTPTPLPKATRAHGEHKDSHVTPRPREVVVDSRGSGASLSSSHPDSESLSPSPMTTPDTSRPQSRKESQPFHLEDTRRTPVISATEDDGSRIRRSHIASVLIDYSSSNYSSRANSQERPSSRGKQEKISKEAITKETTISSEKSIAGDMGLTDDLWTKSALPLDSDQLSFTSAVTHIDVKTSTASLTQIEPLSLDAELKSMNETREEALKQLVIDSPPQRRPSLNKSLSETDLTAQANDTSFLPPLRHQALTPRSPARPPASHGRAVNNDVDLLPSQRARGRTASSESYLQPPNAAASAYLQEARKAVSPSPQAPKSSSTLSLPANIHGTAPRHAPVASAAMTAPTSKAFVPTSSHLSLDTTGLKPIAKMFVECCNCKFYHDMPSRVYEAMAKPDDLVKDSKLGVFGAVTTCVKCPWCAHNMSTQCCAGYAAVVYLREKLHGA